MHALHLLAQSHFDAAEDLPHGFTERVAEGVDAESINAAEALCLDQVALNTRHNGPDVAEGDAGEQEAPQQGHGDAEDSREQPVAPVLGEGEGGVADLPHSVHAVAAVWLSNHILKFHLGSKDMLIIQKRISLPWE